MFSAILQEFFTQSGSNTFKSECIVRSSDVRYFELSNKSLLISDYKFESLKHVFQTLDKCYAYLAANKGGSLSERDIFFILQAIRLYRIYNTSNLDAPVSNVFVADRYEVNKSLISHHITSLNDFKAKLPFLEDHDVVSFHFGVVCRFNDIPRLFRYHYYVDSDTHLTKHLKSFRDAWLEHFNLEDPVNALVNQ